MFFCDVFQNFCEISQTSSGIHTAKQNTAAGSTYHELMHYYF